MKKHLYVWYLKLVALVKSKREANLAFRMTLAIVPGLTSFAVADTDTFDGVFGESRIGGIICGITDALSGPIGIAIGVVVLAIGGLMIAFGGKRAVSFIIWGVVGVGIALAAVPLAGVLFGTDGLCEYTTGDA